MRDKALMLLACLWLGSGWMAGAMALTIDQPLPDPQSEARARSLFREIRCVVCQGETIADSPAVIAVDMRRVIREHIAQGESNRQIKFYLVSRYGTAILMRPPLMASTWLLWFGPLLLLFMASLLAWRYFNRHSPAEPPL